MILPTTTPVTYIYQETSSNTQKCLEREENADILQKTLKPEALTDTEAERISECVKERKQSIGKLTVAFLGMIVLLVFLSLLFGILQ